VCSEGVASRAPAPRELRLQHRVTVRRAASFNRSELLRNRGEKEAMGEGVEQWACLRATLLHLPHLHRPHPGAGC
jgi:hypothetical protein